MKLQSIALTILFCLSAYGGAISGELFAAPQVDARELVNEYKDNSIAADLKYKGKKINLTGDIVDIGTDILGGYYVILLGGPGILDRVGVGLNKKDEAIAATLKKGSTFNALVIVTGEILGMVTVQR